MGGVTKYHRSKMACCITRASSSSSVPMHKVTTNVQRASLGALLGVTGNDGFWREGVSISCVGREAAANHFCKWTYDVFTHLCSNDYAHQNTQCVIRNTSRSIMLLTTHKHDSKIISKSDPTKTCARCGENKFPLRAQCEGFTFPTNGPRYPRSRQ